MTYQRSVYRQQGWSTIGSYLFSLLIIYIFFSLSTDAFQYLGFTPLAAIIFLLFSIITSAINIPIKVLEGEVKEVKHIITFFGISYNIPITQKNDTLIAINVGGAVLPIVISIYLWITHPFAIVLSLISILIASLIINQYAQPINGLGIALPMWVPVVCASMFAAFSALFHPEVAPIVGYTTGVIGSLIGADLLNLHKVTDLGAPVASIGGAGTYDGIFISGIMSVVLLAIFGFV